MISTPVFFASAGAAAAAAFLAIRRMPSEAAARRFARAFWIATVVLAAASFVSSAGRSLKVLPAGLVRPLAVELLGYRFFVPLGVATAAAALAAPARRHAARRAFVLSPRVRGALRLSIALAYLGVEIGKLTHEAEMREFFVGSGLPAWMNPAVIASETVLAAALFWPATEIVAAAGLSFIMAGAILTHAHNGDPFSDSLEALHMLGLLVGFAVLTLAARGREVAMSGIPSRA
ncbi:MAG: DoxX family protein [Syntrophomonadaceae bacterium]